MIDRLIWSRFLERSVLVSLPPAAGILAMVMYLTVESVRPGMFTTPQPESMAEAIVLGNGPRAVEMIAEGHDVNAGGIVRAGMFDEGEYVVTPLEAALLSQRIEVVRLLLASGADVSRSPRAPCLARTRLPEATPLLGLPDNPPSAGGFAACFTVSTHVDPHAQGRG
jgi:hypothetical protein